MRDSLDFVSRWFRMPMLNAAALVLAVLAPAFAVVAQSSTVETARPNVLIIVIDDLNNWIGAMGGPSQTPNIDRLAASGVLFTNAHCVVPACNPSRVAMLTGLRPETTGQFTNDGDFRKVLPGNEAIVTLPQYFRSHGYEAVAAGKIFHESHGTGDAPHPLSDPVSWDMQRRGYTSTSGRKLYTDADGSPLWHEGAGKAWGKYWATGCFWGPIPDKREVTGDWKTATYCADYLAQPHDKPFVMACGIIRPHSPQCVPQEYFDRYPLDSVVMPECPPDDMDDVPVAQRSNGSSPMVAEMKRRGLWREAVRAYLASSSFADDCVGVVIDALDRSPHRDNTIVVLVSDHGWHLGTKNRWEKFSLWHEATNAPLIVRAKGIAPGVCARAVSLLDVFPTLTELAGLPGDAKQGGVSLMPWLRDPAAPRAIPAIVSLLGGHYAVEWEEWNYVRYADGTEELYRHSDDPHEWHNLAADVAFAEIKGTLKMQLAAVVRRP